MIKTIVMKAEYVIHGCKCQYLAQGIIRAETMTDRPTQTTLPLAAALALRDELAAARVRAVHWKSNDHLAEALAGITDIDLYVPREDMVKFFAVMARLRALRITSQPWAQYPGVEDWLLFDDASGGLLHIHLHNALLTGLKRVKHLAIPWEKALLEGIRPAPGSGFPIPAPELEFLMLLVRIWAKMPPWRRLAHPRIPNSIVRELNWLRGQSEASKVSELMARLLPGTKPQLVLDVLDASAPTTRQIIAAARLLNSALTNAQRMSWGRGLSTAAVRNGNMLLHRGMRLVSDTPQVAKTLPGRGLVVAVVGSDGAGKSTVTSALTHWLRFKLDTHNLYLGTGDGGTSLFDATRRGIRGLARLTKGRTTSASPRAEAVAKDPTPTATPFSRKIFALHHLPLAWRKLSQMRLAQRLAETGRIVILDRLAQVQFPGLNDGPRLQSAENFSWSAQHESRLFSKIIALKPDLVIRLNVDTETAYQRKPDHARETLARKSAIVASLHFEGTRVVDIDAAQPLDAVLLTAKRAIWQGLQERPT
jgi:thymidylate kinase